MLMEPAVIASIRNRSGAIPSACEVSWINLAIKFCLAAELSGICDKSPASLKVNVLTGGIMDDGANT